MKIQASRVLASAALGVALLIGGCTETMNLSSARSYDQTFLSNYNSLKPRGKDFIYVTADSQRLLAAAKGVLVDQPQIHIAAASPFTGAKPADLTAIAEAMRSELTGALQKAGYTVATAPGPNILVLRLALTDVYLQAKPRGVLGYTPFGFVVGTGISALQSVMQKYEILGVTLQAEVTDSASNALVFELVLISSNAFSFNLALSSAKTLKISNGFKTKISRKLARFFIGFLRSHIPVGLRIELPHRLVVCTCVTRTQCSGLSV